jgi:hypothetical protein
MIKVIQELVKLASFSLLYSLKDDKKLRDGSFFKDIRLNILSRLIETVKDNFTELNLKRYLSSSYDSFYLEVDRMDKSKTDIYVNISYIHDLEKKLYYVNMNTDSRFTVIYDLTFDTVLKCIYHLNHSKLFPFKYGIAYCDISEDIESLVIKIREKENKHETDSKISIFRKIKQSL